MLDTKSENMKKDDGLGDWRIAAVARLAEDLPAAFPGGPSHKSGAPVYQSEHVQNSKGEFIGFIASSATAMAFHIAIEASKKALGLYDMLTYDDVLTLHGHGKSISKERSGELFDFFEQCMISATFSFQALETFCNHTIARELKQPMKFERRKKNIILNPQEIERQFSTDEKLATVLPKIKNVPTPKGKKIWEQFKVLKDARDSTIHLKAIDQYSANTTGKETLFFQFFNHKAVEYPLAAEAMIQYFVGDNKPRWLDLLRIQLATSQKCYFCDVGMGKEIRLPTGVN